MQTQVRVHADLETHIAHSEVRVRGLWVVVHLRFVGRAWCVILLKLHINLPTAWQKVAFPLDPKTPKINQNYKTEAMEWVSYERIKIQMGSYLTAPRIKQK